MFNPLDSFCSRSDGYRRCHTPMTEKWWRWNIYTEWRDHWSWKTLASGSLLNLTKYPFAKFAFQKMLMSSAKRNWLFLLRQVYIDFPEEIKDWKHSPKLNKVVWFWRPRAQRSPVSSNVGMPRLCDRMFQSQCWEFEISNVKISCYRLVFHLQMIFIEMLFLSGFGVELIAQLPNGRLYGVRVKDAEAWDLFALSNQTGAVQGWVLEHERKNGWAHEIDPDKCLSHRKITKRHK